VKPKKEIELELFEEHSEVNYYSFKFEGEDLEIDKFFDKFEDSEIYEEDLFIIIDWLDKIGERGAKERYFRPEGKYRDNIVAIPVETNNLRLYCIRINENIVILGNGDVKSSRTYNEDETLKAYVETLQKLDFFIKSRVQKQTLTIYNRQFINTGRGNRITFNL